MKFKDPEIRKNSINVMKEIVASSQPRFDDMLIGILNPAERFAFEEVRNMAWEEGKWYRPPHNVIVTASGIASYKFDPEKCSEFVKLNSIIHDAGYQTIELGGSEKGAVWEAHDVRLQHMEGSKIFGKRMYELLRTNGLITITDEEIEVQCNILGEHDNPYLMLPMNEEESKFLRDADRAYVPSASSYYKDLITHYDDEGYLRRAAELGEEVSPEFFLRARMALMWPDTDWIPVSLDTDRFPLETRLRHYSEGKGEPQRTEVGKEIVDAMLLNRARELEGVMSAHTVEYFGKIFEDAYVLETQRLINYAAKPSERSVE